MKKIIVFLCIALLSACATVTRAPYGVTPEVQAQIGEDLFQEMDKTFYANKTAIKVKPENTAEIVVADMARRAGFAVSETIGDPLEIRIYYQAEINSYIATMTVGELRRFNKEYRVTPEGVRQVGALSVGG